MDLYTKYFGEEFGRVLRKVKNERIRDIQTRSHIDVASTYYSAMEIDLGVDDHRRK